MVQCSLEIEKFKGIEEPNTFDFINS